MANDDLKLEFPDQDALGFTFGLPLALAYADVGLAGYNRLAEAFEDSQANKRALEQDVSIGAIAPAMVLAFSAELLFKLLVYQRTGKFPRGHKLKYLYKKLPNDVQENLKKRYDEALKRPGRPLTLEYRITATPGPSNFKKHIDADSQGDSFEIALHNASPLFEKLRYLFEEVTIGFNEKIDFSWLTYIVDALRAEVLLFTDGPVKISMKW